MSDNNFPTVFTPRPDLGRSPAGLAERSTRMVKEALRDSLRRGDDMPWNALRAGGMPDVDATVICIGFPNKPCPAGIVPARSWRSGRDLNPGSGGSGTWSTLALAVGHNIETWMFPLGEGHESPYWCSRINSFDVYNPEHITLFGRHFTPAPSLFAQEVQS